MGIDDNGLSARVYRLGLGRGHDAAAFAYILWHTAMRRAPIQPRTTPVDAYLLLFIGVGFFLMCAVSPDMGIAIDGYRAVVQYLF